jgi:hypothetical protein
MLEVACDSPDYGVIEVLCGVELRRAGSRVAHAGSDGGA